MKSQYFLLSLNIIILSFDALNALVVYPTSSAGGTRTHPVDSDVVSQNTKYDIRVRKTEMSDLDQVSTIMSSADSGSGDKKWNVLMERLRARASYNKQLFQRLNAIVEGRNVLLKFDASEQQSLWANCWKDDAFRSKVKSAVHMSAEKNHALSNHNFYEVPENPDIIMQHAMMTAEDTITGNVVGFMEIAILQQDSCATDRDINQDNSKFGPVICNLAVCQEHRRLGIASHLLKVGQRYVKSHWKLDSKKEMGLYVDESNVAARRLYLKEGFDGARLRTTGRSKNVNPASKLIYMKMPLKETSPILL